MLVTRDGWFAVEASLFYIQKVLFAVLFATRLWLTTTDMIKENINYQTQPCIIELALIIAGLPKD